MISFIVAYAKNQVMGKNNQLPWQIHDDLQLFKAYTLNKPIVMGRKTFESIGRPLPQRRNIVLSRKNDYHPKNIEVYHSIQAINDLLINEPEIMIIGGAEIFQLYLPFVEKIYLSKVDAQIDGDVFFPNWKEQNWQRIKHQRYPQNAKNEFAFDFEIWEKK